MSAARASAPQRRRPATCLSDFALDRLHHGELEGTGGGAQARGHLATCAACGERLARLAGADPTAGGQPPALDLDRLLAAGPAPISPPPPRLRRARRAVTALVGTAALAAGALLWVGSAPPSTSGQRDAAGTWG